jgi:predicted nucleotidyltransferase
LADADGIVMSERDRAIVRSVLAPFADRIDRVGVFGSRALGTARPASDIDLILWGDIDGRTLARLATLFGESSLAVSVDVILYGPELAAALRRHIDRVAKTLFIRADLRTEVVQTGIRG